MFLIFMFVIFARTLSLEDITFHPRNVERNEYGQYLLRKTIYSCLQNTYMSGTLSYSAYRCINSKHNVCSEGVHIHHNMYITNSLCGKFITRSFTEVRHFHIEVITRETEILTFSFLAFNYRWSPENCRHHRVIFTASDWRNIYCGHRSKWHLITVDNKVQIDILIYPRQTAELLVQFEVRRMEIVQVVLSDTHVLNTRGIIPCVISLFHRVKVAIATHTLVTVPQNWIEIGIRLTNTSIPLFMEVHDGPGVHSPLLFHGQIQFEITQLQTTTFVAYIKDNHYNQSIIITYTSILRLYRGRHKKIFISQEEDTYYKRFTMRGNNNNNFASSVAFIWPKKTNKIYAVHFPSLKIIRFRFASSCPVNEEGSKCPCGGLYVFSITEQSNKTIVKPLHFLCGDDDYSELSEVDSASKQLVALSIFQRAYSIGYVVFGIYFKFCSTQYFTPTDEQRTFNLYSSLDVCSSIIILPNRLLDSLDIIALLLPSENALGTILLIIENRRWKFHEGCGKIIRINYTAATNWPYDYKPVFSEEKIDISMRRDRVVIYRYIDYLYNASVIFPQCSHSGGNWQIFMKVHACDSLANIFLLNIKSLTSLCPSTIYVKKRSLEDPVVLFIQPKRVTSRIHITLTYRHNCPMVCRNQTYLFLDLNENANTVSEYRGFISKTGPTFLQTGLQNNGFKLLFSKFVCSKNCFINLQWTTSTPVNTYLPRNQISRKKNRTYISRRGLVSS